MRVGIVTCNRANNYGARLQAYALWRHLSDLGHEAMVIDWCPPYLDFGMRLFYNPGLNIKEWVKLIVRYPERRSNVTKFDRLQQFSTSMTRLTPTTYTSIDQLRSNPPEADVYIAGSDQIWNTLFRNGSDPTFYLDFGDKLTRRISYAASFATEKIERGLSDFVRDNLKRFDAVSVREESGRAISQNLGIDADICCDPAFLLCREQWNEVCEKDQAGERFLLVYDFERGESIKKVAKKIAKARGLKIYTVSWSPLRYADCDYSDCSPSTFLWLVKNADCVLSNSLHGTIFSIIYGKDFYVVDRADGLNVRIHELMRRYGLLSRLISTDTDEAALLRHIDYTDTLRHLDTDVERSKKWLSDNLRSHK